MDCRSFDEQVARRDPQISKLMDEFVSVRVVQGNGMDLSLFQFDYDLTFCIFFLNADQTIYGRFGSRSSHKDAARDMSLEGLQKALAAALQLHKNYPANKETLAGKRGPAPRFRFPEEYPSLKGKYPERLDYEGKVVQSCMHCHQVREAERLYLREAQLPISNQVVYPWPMPDAIGMSLDPKEMATVASVKPNTPAASAGLQKGDVIHTFAGQPMLSIADVQWVLHQAADQATLPLEISRDGKKRALQLSLDNGWRENVDISWRVSSWDLRRMASGGLVLKDLDDEKRKQRQLSENELALIVDYVGEYGQHAAGKKAGFKKDDILLGKDRLTESQWLARRFQTLRPGQKTKIEVLRDKEKVQLELPVQ